MNKKNEQNAANISSSKQRRLARQAEVAQAKRKARISKIVSFSILAVVVIGIGTLIGTSIYRNATKIKPTSDYSAQLTEQGFIKDVDASQLVTLPDLSQIEAPLADIEYSDESVENDITNLLKQHSVASTDTTNPIAMEDKVNIDYIGYIDGEEFDNTEDQEDGTEFIVGSNYFIDDFEEQLVGHKIGDNVTVDVTFPDDYKTPELAGKDASFEVTINKIYLVPEFTDEFVKENLADTASTTEEYITYLKDTNYEKNLTAWVERYLAEHSTVSSYPKSYVEHLRSIKKQESMDTYTATNEFYKSYLGTVGFSSYEEFLGMKEQEFDKSLTGTAKVAFKNLLIYQAIAQQQNFTVSADDYIAIQKETKEFGDEEYTKAVSQYGESYLMQTVLKDKAIDYVKSLVKVS